MKATLEQLQLLHEHVDEIHPDNLGIWIDWTDGSHRFDDDLEFHITDIIENPWDPEKRTWKKRP